MVIQRLVEVIKENQIFIGFLVIITASLFLFYPSLNYYFFQDDWFVLNKINNAHIGDLVDFFKFRTDIIYWRPVGMFLFFFIGKNLFGLNPLGFHLISIFLHLVNSFLIGYLSFILFKNKVAAITAAFLYSTAAFHFMTLSWLSLTWNIIGSTFFLLALISYLIFKRQKSKLMLILTFFFFCISLASTEFALVFPVFIVFFELFYEKFDTKKTFKNLAVIIPISLIDSLYLLARFTVVPVPATGEYAPTIDLRIVNNIFWYCIWLFNIPEVLKYHLQISQLSFSKDPTFLEPFKSYFLPIFFSLLVFLSSMIYLLHRAFNLKVFKRLFGTFILLILGLLPVIFLPQHSFPYYLAIPSISFFVFIAYLLTKALNNVVSVSRIVIFLLVGGWFFASLSTISFTRKTHWIPGEENTARKSIEYIKNRFDDLPSNSTIVVNSNNKQLKQALMDQNALQVLYNNKTLKTIFLQSDNIEESFQYGSYYINIK